MVIEQIATLRGPDVTLRNLNIFILFTGRTKNFGENFLHFNETEIFNEISNLNLWHTQSLLIT